MSALLLKATWLEKKKEREKRKEGHIASDLFKLFNYRILFYGVTDLAVAEFISEMC